MSVCGFCQGQPVSDARTWTDGTPRPPAPCPRCGETNIPVPDEAPVVDPALLADFEMAVRASERVRIARDVLDNGVDWLAWNGIQGIADRIMQGGTAS